MGKIGLYTKFVANIVVLNCVCDIRSHSRECWKDFSEITTGCRCGFIIRISDTYIHVHSALDYGYFRYVSGDLNE